MKTRTVVQVLLLAGVAACVIAADNLRDKLRSTYGNQVDVSAATARQWFSPTGSNAASSETNFRVRRLELDWISGAAPLVIDIFLDDAAQYTVSPGVERLTIPAGASFDIEGHRMSGYQVISGPAVNDTLRIRGSN